MSRFTLHDTFVVHQYALDNWDGELHGQAYFQILFVERGSGYITVNGNRFSYSENKIFLLEPEAKYHLDIDTHTRLSFFKFTELLFSSKVNLPERQYWMRRIEQLLHHSQSIQGDVICHHEDRQVVWDIHQVVLDEFRSEKIYFQEIISNAVSTILSVIVRNFSEKQKKENKNNVSKTSKIDQILAHIRQNVYNNDRTKISFLASKFNMSQSSISTFFKRKTGESIHQYVTKYKMKLVEHRLKNTEFTIAEIANQLGYTDESHLTKTFKKHFSMSPKRYREEAATAAAVTSGQASV